MKLTHPQPKNSLGPVQCRRACRILQRIKSPLTPPARRSRGKKSLCTGSLGIDVAVASTTTSLRVCTGEAADISRPAGAARYCCCPAYRRTWWRFLSLRLSYSYSFLVLLFVHLQKLLRWQVKSKTADFIGGLRKVSHAY